MKQSNKRNRRFSGRFRWGFYVLSWVIAPVTAQAMSIHECRYDAKGNERQNRYVAFTNECPAPFAGCFDERQNQKRVGCIHDADAVEGREPASLGEVHHPRKVRFIDD